jgi:hypothetical protein
MSVARAQGACGPAWHVTQCVECRCPSLLPHLQAPAAPSSWVRRNWGTPAPAAGCSVLWALGGGSPATPTPWPPQQPLPAPAPGHRPPCAVVVQKKGAQSSELGAQKPDSNMQYAIGRSELELATSVTAAGSWELGVEGGGARCWGCGVWGFVKALFFGGGLNYRFSLVLGT